MNFDELAKEIFDIKLKVIRSGKICEGKLCNLKNCIPKERA